MPLLIEIKTGDKLIINGAVIENAGPNSKLLVHNKATILRGKEVLSQDESCTPASRTYYALQCAYIFPDEPRHLEQFRTLLDDYVRACPSASDIRANILDDVNADRLYKGLKKAHALIEHENKLVTQMFAQAKELETEIGENTGANTESSEPPENQPPS